MKKLLNVFFALLFSFVLSGVGSGTLLWLIGFTDTSIVLANGSVINGDNIFIKTIYYNKLQEYWTSSFIVIALAVAYVERSNPEYGGKEA